MNELELSLLNDFQRGFPLQSRPFAVLAERCGTSEDRVLRALRDLGERGFVSRVGAVFAPGRIGASTLFALEVPPARLNDVVARLDALPNVNHSYEREHAFNLWAVAAAYGPSELQDLLEGIRADTGLRLLDLPLLEEYRIDLGFDLRGAGSVLPATLLNGKRHELQPIERRLVGALQAGVALVEEPFRDLAGRIGVSESTVLSVLARWMAVGIVRRFGVIVRHHELGYRANAMAVWDVPDERVTEMGHRLAATPGVTLAYRRRRSLPQWRFNLFCMMHGKERAAVTTALEAIGSELELDVYPHTVLFSRQRFKQTGARYITSETQLAHG